MTDPTRSSPKEYRVVWRRGQPPWREDVTLLDGSEAPPLTEGQRTRRKVFQTEAGALRHVERMRTAKAYFDAMPDDYGGSSSRLAELEYVRVDCRTVGDWVEVL